MDIFESRISIPKNIKTVKTGPIFMPCVFLKERSTINISLLLSSALFCFSMTLYRGSKDIKGFQKSQSQKFNILTPFLL